MLEICTLEKLSFGDLIAAFLEAFEGYFVKMPEDPEYYRERWQAAGLKFQLSFGAFYQDQLVGFILHGIDRRDSDLIAFNTGTGVIPEFRGRHIVSNIYSHALPILRSAGITKSKLEVIQQNHTAVKVYQRVGFEITRNYKCFQGELATVPSTASVDEIEIDDLDWAKIPHQSLQSWDHQKASLIKGPYHCYQASMDGSTLGFIALNAAVNHVALCEIITDNPDDWEHLLAALKTITPLARITNVDSSLTEKIEALKKAGLKNTIDQYEMELNLKL